MTYPELLAEAWRQHLAPRAKKAPTVISTFAGCGGSSLGYSMAGYRELLAIEWDENACATFALNFPGVLIHRGDITKLTSEAVMQLAGVRPGELDVLDGSPPCQGFSTAGKRNLDDSRNQLFREFVRLLRDLQPRAFVMENVSGMVKGKMKLVFVEILRELKACGYQVSARLMNAMYFDVPQSRARMIFIGTREGVPSHPGPSSRPRTTRDAIGSDVFDRKQPGANVSPLREKRWNETRRGHAHHERFALVRLRWDKTPATILKVSGSGGHFHPDEPRLLSTGELQRIASFPDEFQLVGNWDKTVERIGNSVPPLFMRAIAEHVRSQILGNAKRRAA